MTLDAMLTVFGLTALSVLAVLAVFVAVPWAGRYTFRSELWKIRDRIVDEVLADRLPGDHPAVRRSIMRAEGAIRFADILGLASIVCLHVAAHRSGQRPEVEPVSTEGLTAEQRALLKQFDGELAECAVRYTMERSVTGWVVTLIGSPFLLAAAVARRMGMRRALTAFRRHIGRDFQVGADSLGRSHA